MYIQEPHNYNIKHECYFLDELKILQEVKFLKNKLYRYFFYGLSILLSHKYPKKFNHFKKKPILWLISLLLNKYGSIYFLSRNDVLLNACSYNDNDINIVGDFINHHKIGFKVINYSVLRFVQEFNGEVKNSEFLIPKNAINSVSSQTIFVREKDFDHQPIDILLSSYSPLFDLHDFSHLILSRVNSDIFGSKYFPCLLRLNKYFQCLITSPYKFNKTILKVSDGMIFSEILTPYYNNLDKSISDKKLVNIMSKKIFLYLLGKSKVFSPKINKNIYLNRNITPIELAVLSQNKCYEWPASEIERYVFTRSGNDVLDEFFDKDYSEVLHLIKNKPTWFYYERRNTLKHRAQRLAYLKLAEYFIEQKGKISSKDTVLSQKVISQLCLKNENIWEYINNEG